MLVLWFSSGCSGFLPQSCRSGEVPTTDCPQENWTNIPCLPSPWVLFGCSASEHSFDPLLTTELTQTKTLNSWKPLGVWGGSNFRQAFVDKQWPQSRADSNILSQVGLMRVTLLLTFSSRLTCPSPPAPGTTAPWRCAAARQSSTPHQSVPTTADRSLCCRRVGSWRWGPAGRQRRADWGRPRLLPLGWPGRWTGTPGLPWEK